MKEITIKLSLGNIVGIDKDIIIRIDKSVLNSGELETDNTGLLAFMEETIKQLDDCGRVRTAETYKCTMNSFRRFREGKDISIGMLNAVVVEGYEAYLKRDGKAMNTISFYMRILRAVYNRAVENGMTCDNKPFRKVYTSREKTVKRALGVDVIRGIRNFKTDNDRMAFARDMFLFSFYTMGMSFVDMAYLKTSDIRNGQLVCHRKKTGQQLCMHWDGRMQEIISRHPSSTGVYLLPIITKLNNKERNQYRHKQYVINCELALIAGMMGLERSLTMYVARHSWASIAKSLNIPMEVISRGMGHNSEKTTLIYIKNMNNDAIDDANGRIMGALD